MYDFANNLLQEDPQKEEKVSKTVSNQARVAEDLRDQVRELRQEVAKYKAAGINLNHYTTCIDPLVENLGARPSGFLPSGTPLATTRYAFGAQAEIQPELRGAGPAKAVSALYVRAIVDKTTNTAVLQMVNVLSQEPEILWSKVIRLGDDGSAPLEKRAELSAEMDNAIKLAAPRIQECISAIEPGAEPNYEVSKRNGNDRSLKEVVQIDDLLSKNGFKVSIEYYPKGGAIDRLAETSDLASAYSLELNGELMRRERFPDVVIAGGVNRIELSRTISNAKLEYDEKGSVVSVNGKPKAGYYIDEHGNQILAQYVPYNNGTAMEWITIVPRTPLSEQPGSTLLPINLTKLGYGEVPSFITRASIGLVTEVSGVKVYVDGDYRSSAEMTHKLERFAEGMKTGELLFGLQPRSAATKILILNSNKPNASFVQTNPDVVEVKGDILTGNRLNPKVIGLHETIHLLDGRSDWTLSGGKFKELHRQLVKSCPQFFSFVDEKHMIPGADKGGHSAKNERELLSSLVNSIQLAIEDFSIWKGKMDKASPEIRKGYRDVLGALCKNIRVVSESGIIEMGKDIPILNEIAKLDNHLARVS